MLFAAEHHEKSESKPIVEASQYQLDLQIIMGGLPKAEEKWTTELKELVYSKETLHKAANDLKYDKSALRQFKKEWGSNTPKFHSKTGTKFNLTDAQQEVTNTRADIHQLVSEANPDIMKLIEKEDKQVEAQLNFLDYEVKKMLEDSSSVRSKIDSWIQSVFNLLKKHLPQATEKSEASAKSNI